jgi:hypothetical protein
MLRNTIFLLLAFTAGVAQADVLDHGAGVFAQLAHQLFSPHHLPLVLLLVAIGVLSMRWWRAERKKT